MLGLSTRVVTHFLRINCVHRSCVKCCQALRENREGRSKTPNQVIQLQRALEKFATMQSKQLSPAEKEVQARTPKVKNTRKRKPSPTRGVTIKRSTLWQVTGPVPHSSSRSTDKSLTSEDDTIKSDIPLKLKDSVETDYIPPERSDTVESVTLSESGKYSDSDESNSESGVFGQSQSSHQEQRERGALVHRLMAQGPASSNVPNRAEPSGWFCDFMNGGTSDATSPSNKACFENLFRSLVQFKEVHGHCAIPPSAGSPHADSSKEEREFARLADWASVQRCLGRAVRSGRKVPTQEEKNRLIRLAKLGFVFDYEEWHWNKKYNELVRFQREESERESKHTSRRSSIDFSKSLGLALWIKEQRHLCEEGSQGKIYKMRRDRLAKLERLNFCWATRDKYIS